LDSDFSSFSSSLCEGVNDPPSHTHSTRAGVATESPNEDSNSAAYTAVKLGKKLCANTASIAARPKICLILFIIFTHINLKKPFKYTEKIKIKKSDYNLPLFLIDKFTIHDIKTQKKYIYGIEYF
jgi:hypothetical protein